MTKINKYPFLTKPKKISEQKWSNEVPPLVSIACITYNQEEMIKDAIESFLMQVTSFRVMIHIHDDASTDKTAKVINSYVQKYPNLFQTIFQKENKRSQGIKPRYEILYPSITNSKYIANCDGDDYWTDPLKLQKQVDFLEANEGYSMCGAVAQCVRDPSDEREFFGDFIGSKKSILKVEDFLSGYSVHTSTVVFRKRMLQMPDWFACISNGDVGLFAILAEKGTVGFLNEPVSVYRINDNGIWSSISLEKRYYAFKNTVNQLNRHFKGAYKKIQYKWEFNEAQKVARQFLEEKSYAQYFLFILKNYYRYFWWFIWLPKQTQIFNFIRNSVQTYWIKFRIFVGLRTRLIKLKSLFVKKKT
jgi:glycosyltransferase involved in cell wall biosynthesis